VRAQGLMRRAARWCVRTRVITIGVRRRSGWALPGDARVARFAGVSRIAHRISGNEARNRTELRALFTRIGDGRLQFAEELISRRRRSAVDSCILGMVVQR
jgi:hypothetical protein